MDIDERLAREAGITDAIPIRQLKGCGRWKRLDCPFCGHERATINHDVNWFQCFACEKTLSGYEGSSDDLAVNRFSVQISQAAAGVMREFGGWLKGQREEVIAQARYYVTNYAVGKPGDPFDAGRLPEWVEKCNGIEEPWCLDAMVRKALFEDLMNWAKKRANWEKANRVMENPEEAIEEPDGGFASRRAANKFRNDAIRRGQRPNYYRSEVPKGTNLGSRRVKYGSLERCDLRRNGLGPYPGHCIWCDKALGRPAEAPPESIDLYREDYDELRRTYPVSAAMEDGYQQSEIAAWMGISVAAVKRRANEEKQRAERLRKEDPEAFFDEM
jgi:hypothetical protein